MANLSTSLSLPAASRDLYRPERWGRSCLFWGGGWWGYGCVVGGLYIDLTVRVVVAVVVVMLDGHPRGGCCLCRCRCLSALFMK